jgi:hypothetical protein
MFCADDRSTVVTRRSDDSVHKTGNAAVCPASDVFDLLWTTLVDILGSPTTAALVRRSILHECEQHRELGELTISRERFEYTYVVPAAWKHVNDQPVAALQALIHTLSVMLMELTGSVVVRRLKQLSRLKDCGYVIPENHS